MDDSLREDLASFFGCEYVLPVGSGTVGLAVILRALGVKGQKVLVPALVCPNVAVAVYAAGGRPVAVEVHTEHYNLTPELIAPALDQETRAVVAVSSFGYPVDVGGIARVASECGVDVIDDACQAYGGFADGTAVGARGEVGVISFGYSKPCSAGGGGAILTNSQDLFRRLDKEAGRGGGLAWGANRLARGLMRREQYSRFAWLARRTMVGSYCFPSRQRRAAASLWPVFLKGMAEARENLIHIEEYLRSSPEIDAFSYQGSEWLPWRYSFRVDPQRRNEARRRLHTSGARTSVLYQPLWHYFRDVEIHGSITRMQALADSTVNLVYRSNPESTAYLLNGIRAYVDEILSS